MKSIKPGRGPSMMEGVTSLLVAGVGVVWTFSAVAMGAGFMAVFGVVFIAIAMINAVGGFYNATAKKRHSIIDIVDSEEEPDPLDPRFSGRNASGVPEGYAPDELDEEVSQRSDGFCPYCGAKTGRDHRFCTRCGKPLK